MKNNVSVKSFSSLTLLCFSRNLDKYDLDALKNEKLDYHKAMEVTSEIIALEVAHRFVVCIFEVYISF